MASSCITDATKTLFGTTFITSQSTSTSDTTITTTVPGTTVVSAQITCAAPVPTNGTCTDEQTISVTSTLPGSVNTVTNQVVITIPVTITQTAPTATLFSTSCSAISQPGSPDPNSQQPPTTTPITTPLPITTPPTTTPIPVTTSSPGFSPTVSTPPPTTLVSSSSVILSDGSVSVDLVTITSTPPPTTLFVPPSSTPGLNDNNTSGNTSSNNTAPIVGGVVGGFLGLIAVVGLIWMFLRRRRRAWDDFATHEKRVTYDDDLPPNVEPAPYRYGLVGGSQPNSLSPPGSPQMAATQNIPATTTIHSRATSGTSMNSGESTGAAQHANMTYPGRGDQTWRQGPQGRTLSGASDAPLLIRPSAQSGPSTPTPILNTNTSSPATTPDPRGPPSSFFVANTSSEDQNGSQHRRSSFGSPGPSSSGLAVPIKDRSRRSSAPPREIIVHTDGGRVDDGSSGNTSPNSPRYPRPGANRTRVEPPEELPPPYQNR